MLPLEQVGGAAYAGAEGAVGADLATGEGVRAAVFQAVCDVEGGEAKAAGEQRHLTPALSA
jgi:hypothetical protein